MVRQSGISNREVLECRRFKGFCLYSQDAYNGDIPNRAVGKERKQNHNKKL